MSSRISFGALLRRFRRDRKGVAAIEFAIIAPVFFGLLFAILETAMMFFASQVLETITQNAARLVMTGQAQGLKYTQNQFGAYVCSQIPALFSCSNMSVDVKSYPSFASITIDSQIDGGGNFIPPTNFQCGGPGDIVVVRVFYPWQMFVTGLGFNITNLAGNKRLLVATAAFQNEPFTTGACS